MPIDQLSAYTSRRTIVKTGAKLAYAAPLVAGTMKLAGRDASAQEVISPVGTTIIVPAVAQGGVPFPIVAGTEYCLTATGNARLCLGDASRNFCPVTPPGDDGVCPPHPPGCCGAAICGLLRGTPTGGGTIDFGAGPTCFIAPATGTLTLFIQDSFYPDNDGQYTVTITS
jgi:hypothetical protein